MLEIPEQYWLPRIGTDVGWSQLEPIRQAVCAIDGKASDMGLRDLLEPR